MVEERVTSTKTAKKPDAKKRKKESVLTPYREAFMDLLFPLNLSCHICKKPLRKEVEEWKSPKNEAKAVTNKETEKVTTNELHTQQINVQIIERKEEQPARGELQLQSSPQTNFEAYLCPTCIDEIPWIDEPYCEKCSIPLYDNTANNIYYEEEILRPLSRPANRCAECADDSPLYRNLSVCLYEKPIKAAIYAFKYSDKTYLARIFALMMAKKLRSLSKENRDFDLILSVPLHKKRLRHRGYNQADLLAKYLSKELQIPYDSKALSRIKETQTMNQLSKSQRAPNVEDAFFVEKSSLKAKKILLIDDIYTTGATAKSIAALLKKQGVAHITMLSIARVVLK